MLTASDLNKEIDDLANKILVPGGFKRSGVHYFKADKGQYCAVIKDTSRGYFVDYFLAFSHESAGAAFTALLKKPSPMLKDYPVSVAVNDLKIIFAVNEKLIDSPYYFYSLSREYKVNKKCREDRAAWDNYFREIIKRNELLTSDKNYLQQYAKDIFSVIANEGLQFFKECNFELCYHAVQRPFAEMKLKQYISYYKTYLDNFNDYCQLKNIALPGNLNTPKTGWFNRLLGHG